MKKWMLLLLLALLTPVCGAWAGSPWEGTYVPYNRDASQALSFQVKYTSGKFEVYFGVPNLLDMGPPRGQGPGVLDKDNALNFFFEDTQGNKGQGTLSTNGDIFFIKWDMRSMKNMAAMQYYQKGKLRKK